MFCLALTILILAFICLSAKVFIVVGTSMWPVLKNRDRVIVICHWPTMWLRKGMVVVAKSPIYYDHTQMLLVKRIVGLAGDIVCPNIPDRLLSSEQVERGGDRDWTNIIDRAQSQVGDGDCYHMDINKARIWKIPQRHFFLRGDSPGTDSDIFGPLPYESLIGVVFMKLWNGLAINEVNVWQNSAKRKGHF